MHKQDDRAIWMTHQEKGMDVVVVDNMENGMIKLKPLQTGKIIANCSQVGADVWFQDIGYYTNDPVTDVLKLDTLPFTDHPRFQGVVLNVKRKHYALKYEYDHEFYSCRVRAEKLDNIPFFLKDESKQKQSDGWYRGRDGAKQTSCFYYMEDLIEIIEHGFNKWIENNVNWIEATEEELENGEWESEYDRVMDDLSIQKTREVKDDLELKFAKSTGIFYDFTGGLVWE